MKLQLNKTSEGVLTDVRVIFYCNAIKSNGCSIKIFLQGLLYRNEIVLYRSQRGFLIQWNLSWDHCHERPPVLIDQTFLAEGPTFQYNWTCHQRPPVLTDHIFVATGVVFQDRERASSSVFCSSYRVLEPELKDSPIFGISLVADVPGEIKVGDPVLATMK